MKELGYGKGYKYAHDFDDKVTSMECLPSNLIGREYYIPTMMGEEQKFAERKKKLKALKKENKGNN